jgi:hypothetical protein
MMCDEAGTWRSVARVLGARLRRNDSDKHISLGNVTAGEKALGSRKINKHQQTGVKG